MVSLCANLIAQRWKIRANKMFSFPSGFPRRIVLLLLFFEFNNSADSLTRSLLIQSMVSLMVTKTYSATLRKSRTFFLCISFSLFTYCIYQILICDLTFLHILFTNVNRNTCSRARTCVSGVNMRSRRISFRLHIRVERPVVTLSTIE